MADDICLNNFLPHSKFFKTLFNLRHYLNRYDRLIRPAYFENIQIDIVVQPPQKETPMVRPQNYRPTPKLDPKIRRKICKIRKTLDLKKPR